jgi:ABC-type transport system involved in multi-copper enzyme maturation permease subunit
MPGKKMMLNLYQAEWRKIFANIKLTSFLIWVYPIGLAAFHIAMNLGSLVSETMMTGVEYFGAGDWTMDSLAVWELLISFPANLFGRMLPLAFMAVVIAGEYQWRTWKNIVPRTQRWKLLLVKMVAPVSLVMVAFILTALIAAMGPSIGHLIHDLPYGPALTADVLSQFILDTVKTGFIALLSLLNLAGYAAIVSILTRSILGGLLGSFGFAVLDATSLGLLLFLRNLFGLPQLINLYQLTPTYNLGNLHSWLFTGEAQRFVATGIAPLTTEPSFWLSLFVQMFWIIGLAGIALLIFQRQEITE